MKKTLYLALSFILTISSYVVWSAAQEVITLDEASSQLEAPQSGDTYLFPRNATFATGTQLTLPLEDDAATPTLNFGDGNTGFYEKNDNELSISILGARRYFFSGDAFNANGANGAGFLNETASSTNPTIIPDRSDVDTGLGAASPSNDQLSLIAGAKEVVRYSEFATTHTYREAAALTHDPRPNVFSYSNEFMQQTWVETDEPWILNSGGDSEAVDGVIVASAEKGQFTLVSGDADGNCTNDCSQMVWKNPVQADSGALVMEVKLHLDATTAVSVNIGFTDITSIQEAVSVAGTTITTTAVDWVGFVYDTAADTDEWYATGVDGNTDMVGAAITGTAPSAGTFQVFRIEVDADGETCRFYINGTLEISGTATCVAASTNIFPFISVNSTTTTSQSVDIEYVYVGHSR